MSVESEFYIQHIVCICTLQELATVEPTQSNVQVCIAIRPQAAEALYLVMLDKSPTQEEFIRGQLTNNPYNSSEVGPLMRDVKNFICRELDMEGMQSPWL